MRRVAIAGANIHIDSLGISKQEDNGLQIYHITASVSKLGTPGDVAVAVLCSSMFPEIADLIFVSLEGYFKYLYDAQESIKKGVKEAEDGKVVSIDLSDSNESV